MNAYAVFVVNEHIEMLRREAIERRSQPAGPTLRARIAAALASVQSKLVPAPTIPTLDGSPSRG